jgi:hypothetical protein
MPIPRKSSLDLARATLKLRKAFENNQGACLLRNEAAAVYAELQQKQQTQQEKTDGK